MKIKMGVKVKLISAIIGLIVVSTAFIGFLSFFQAAGGLEKGASADLEHVVSQAYALCQTQYTSRIEQVKSSMAVARDAFNSFGGRVTDISGGKMVLTGRGTDFAVNDNFFIVDKVKELTGSTCTIFQIKDDGAYRISTNVLNENGDRAIGTKLSTEVYDKVKSGQSYVGRAKILNEWYLASYEPIKNQRGDIIGVLYCGVKEKDSDLIKKALLSLKIGETGYLYCMDMDGILTVHPNSEGKSIASNDFCKEMLAKAPSLGPQDLGWIQYKWDRKGKLAEKIVAYKYIKEWNWVVAAGSYMDEFTAGANAVATTVLIGTLVTVALGSLVGLFLAGSITRPLNGAVHMIQELAKGHLGNRLRLKRSDEIGILANTMDDFADDLQNNVMAAVKKIGEGDLSSEIKSKDTQDEIAPALQATINSLKGLVNETTMLAGMAVEGNLSSRGDISKFKGGYQDIIAGINETLEAVIRPVNEAVICLEDISQGDLSGGITSDHKGDHAIMKNSLNITLASLNDILGQVSLSVEQIASGSQQVSDSSQSLSQGATEQASSIEEVTSSVTEMTAQTKQNAENATQANQLASSARDYAGKGNEQMQEMLRAMHEINESSSQISKIIKVIDEIAFQTNLLALNAAVEAARAGVHGKGFAVVAEEVRNLAQRSAKAAKETTELIEGSVKKVENGTNIANATAKALEEIVGGITKVTDLVGEIASASNEQAQGIEQVNQGLGQIDQVTQSNTASAEESASASEELSGQAAQLKQMLSKFRLKNQNQNAYQEPVSHREPSAKPKKTQGWGDSKTRKQPQHATIALDDKEFGKF